MDIQEDEQHWHLDKRVTVSQIVSTVALAVAMTVFFLRLEKTIALNEQRIEALEEDRIEIAEEIKDGFVQVRQDLRRMEDKLDKKVDK